MRDRLELKHLAPYLPYKLKFTGYLKHNSSLPFDDSEDILTLCPFVLAYLDQEFEEFKPILRPLSDLDKDNFKEMGINHNWYGLKNYLTNIKEMKVKDFEYLVRNHFDVFGLIEKGLAIDINTTQDAKTN